MAAKQYLLMLPELMGGTIRLSNPCPVGREPDGRPVLMNPLDPRSFGRSFLAETGPDTLWHARAEAGSLDDLKDLYGFHCGAIVSPRARAIIEEDGVPNIEFIPLEILQGDSDRMLGQWWFVNVFNWRKVFDFKRSKLAYDDFPLPPQGLNGITLRFGDRFISEWDLLEVDPEALEDGLFLAEAPMERIWSRVYIAERLALRLNEGLPTERRIHFEQFWLDRGPGPKFDRSGYSYAGRPGDRNSA